MRGSEIPNQRQRRARREVKGVAALEPALHRNRFRTKNIANDILRSKGTVGMSVEAICGALTHPGTKKAVASTLDFHCRPPITAKEGVMAGE